MNILKCQVGLHDMIWKIQQWPSHAGELENPVIAESVTPDPATAKGLEDS